jgi:hypothetical protein
MLRRGNSVTFTAVARAAGVSTWLVYADGVREHIERAITRRRAVHRPGSQRKQPTHRLRTGRAQIRQLRAERDELRHQLAVVP